MGSKSLYWLYVLNLALAAGHQVVAADVREWGLLGLDIGIQGFTILTFLIVGFFAHGLVELARGKRAGLWYSMVLAGGGLVSTACHVLLLAGGDSGFTHPVALVLLAATGTASLAQLTATIRATPGWPGRAEMPKPEFYDE